MGKSQRTKGATFEREVCALFSAALGREIKRNIGQARDGANDIDVGPLCVEAKRRATLGTVYGWLQQAIDAVRLRKHSALLTGAPVPEIPIVVARQDGDTSPIVILRFDDFIALTRGRI